MGTPIVGQHVLFQLPDWHRDSGRLVAAIVDSVHSATCISLSTMHPKEAFTSVLQGTKLGQWTDMPEDAVHAGLRAENAKLKGDLEALQAKAPQTTSTEAAQQHQA